MLAFSSYCLYKYISGPEVVVRPDTKKLTNRLTLYHDINVWDDTYLIWFTTVIRQDSTWQSVQQVDRLVQIWNGKLHCLEAMMHIMQDWFSTNICYSEVGMTRTCWWRFRRNVFLEIQLTMRSSVEICYGTSRTQPDVHITIHRIFLMRRLGRLTNILFHSDIIFSAIISTW